MSSITGVGKAMNPETIRKPGLARALAINLNGCRLRVAQVCAVPSGASEIGRQDLCLLAKGGLDLFSTEYNNIFSLDGRLYVVTVTDDSRSVIWQLSLA